MLVRMTHLDSDLRLNHVLPPCLLCCCFRRLSEGRTLPEPVVAAPGSDNELLGCRPPATGTPTAVKEGIEIDELGEGRPLPPAPSGSCSSGRPHREQHRSAAAAAARSSSERPAKGSAAPAPTLLRFGVERECFMADRWWPRCLRWLFVAAPPLPCLRRRRRKAKREEAAEDVEVPDSRPGRERTEAL